MKGMLKPRAAITANPETNLVRNVLRSGKVLVRYVPAMDRGLVSSLFIMLHDKLYTLSAVPLNRRPFSSSDLVIAIFLKAFHKME